MNVSNFLEFYTLVKILAKTLLEDYKDSKYKGYNKIQSQNHRIRLVL